MSTDVSHDIDTTDDAIDTAVTAAYARAKLVNAADLVAHVRGLVAPGSAQPSDGQPLASSVEAPLPIRVDPLEASDRVYAHLLNWVRYWADALQVQPPVVATYAWSTEDGPQGFRSTVTPLGAWGLTQTLTPSSEGSNDRVLAARTTSWPRSMIAWRRASTSGARRWR